EAVLAGRLIPTPPHAGQLDTCLQQMLAGEAAHDIRCLVAEPDVAPGARSRKRGAAELDAPILERRTRDQWSVLLIVVEQVERDFVDERRGRIAVAQLYAGHVVVG